MVAERGPRVEPEGNTVGGINSAVSGINPSHAAEVNTLLSLVPHLNDEAGPYAEKLTVTPFFLK